jgi:hypothetical protein
MMRGKVKSKSKLSYMHVMVTILELKRGFSCDVDRVPLYPVGVLPHLIHLIHDMQNRDLMSTYIPI